MNKGTDIFSLDGKFALVTGATGHLGREMAYVLAEAGATVLINSRDARRAADLTSALQAEGLSAESAVFDITSRSSIEKCFGRFSFDELSILINNANAGGPGTIRTSTHAQYAASFDIGLIAVHELLQVALPLLTNAAKRNRDASVINISSMYGNVSPDPRLYDSPESTNPPFYGATKAALIQWTRYAACEFGAEGIRFNSVSPGPFPSPEVQAKSPDFVASLAARTPLGRIGHQSEIKGIILFLASAASSFVTGADMRVDGGWTSW